VPPTGVVDRSSRVEWVREDEPERERDTPVAPAATTPTTDPGVATIGTHATGEQAGELAGKAIVRLGGHFRHLVLALLALCAVLAAELPTPALAATREWTGAGPDNNWTTAANWSGNIAPSEGDDLVFPDGVTKLTTINTFGAGTTFSSITFRGSRYTVGGNRFVLLNGISALNPTLGNTIGVQIELARDQTFLVQSPDASLLVSAGVPPASRPIIRSPAARRPGWRCGWTAPAPPISPNCWAAVRCGRREPARRSWAQRAPATSDRSWSKPERCAP
jgi:hypothetical protein